MFDVHCHIHENPVDAAALNNLQTSRLCLMGTNYRDWQTVRTLAQQYPSRVIPAFGIHPWYADRLEELVPSSKVKTWEKELEDLLIEFPNSIVGEIGLDKLAVNLKTGLKYNFESQLFIFKKQFEIAKRLNKPVSIHCVKAQGIMIEFLQRNSIQDQKIMLHSYSGSADSLKLILSIKAPKIYFSVSELVNMRSMKLEKILDCLPKNKLLLESDTNALENVDSKMENIKKHVSKIYHMEKEVLEAITMKNSLLFFGLDQ